jgi:hypothetical protein
MRHLLVTVMLAVSAAAQQEPNVAAQKEAMKKLAFLVGTWKGEATVYRQGGPIQVNQTEEVEYRLGGLVLLVQGTGRSPATGEVVFGALATISYDDVAKAYRFRSHNDGRFLDTEMKVPENGFEWGYTAGPAKVTFRMKLNEKAEWAETGDVVIGGQAPRKSVELVVRKQ